MADKAISLDRIGKQYLLRERSHKYKALRDVLANAYMKPFRRFRGAPAEAHSPRSSSRELFWALKDISFEVRHGEVLGLIGSNGAGKSTLLKVLSRITEPTTGRAVIYGRVGSLLEVGSGFHPELTGRENVFLNGAIIGMRKAEIERKFDEIVAFAEVERFIDTPVKHYSSGMYLKLAFAVAANLEPEILFVDEVLAVGDAAFQRKCLGKMGEVSRQGRTVLFVSHNMTAVQSLCTRAIWLAQGQLVADGSPAQIVADYLRSNSAAAVDQVWEDPATAPGNEVIRIHRARLLAKDSYHITVNDSVQLEFLYWNFLNGAVQNASLTLYTLEGVAAFSSASLVRECPAGLIRVVCTIPGDFLNDGGYRVQLMIVRDTSTILYNHQSLLTFEVRDVPRPYSWYGKWIGVVRPKLEWDHEVVDTVASVVSSGVH